jgi:hypothetical protein
LPTRSAEGSVKDIIHCPAIEIRFESPTENHSRARPEGDIVKSGNWLPRFECISSPAAGVVFIS